MDWVTRLAEGSSAAAEAIAAARGHPSASPPEEVVSWVRKKPTLATDLIELAKAAVDRIGRKSELKDLWEESDSADDWRAALTDLRKRLD